MGIESSFDHEPHGISQTKRLTVGAAEEILFKPYTCLDHGFVRLIDYMGGDESIVQAARVSYGRGTKQVSEDEGLIRYLMRHNHATPLEMVDIKVHAKLPIFVARQWIRHRTASVNEISARYSVLDNEFYLPEPEVICSQATNNRQGREKTVTPEQAREILDILKSDATLSYNHYESLLNVDSSNPSSKKPLDPSKPMLARELARMNLPVSIYTQWYWKTNLRNMFHFLGLRMDSHAQHEIRVYANAMADMTKRIAPVAYGAFEDYNLNAVSLSALDQRAIQLMLREGISPEQAARQIFTSRRESEEFIAKATRLKQPNVNTP